MPKLNLGLVVQTPGAAAALAANRVNPGILLARYVQGDWGDVSPGDRLANDTACLNGSRVLAAYVLPDGTKLWIITEWDRSVTTLLLPEEY